MEGSSPLDGELVCRFDWTEYESPGLAVVEAIADVTETEPTAIEPLYGTIDPDALEELLGSVATGKSSSHSVTQFEHLGFAVTLCSGGEGFLSAAEEDDGHRSPS